ncbi:GH116 family glycosyl hydrolase [Cohnella rhizosphaerae]|uniref:Non-lysosomal glucosylceramidase n=1 Tax=Cohnella rhizosphaerae TaxID=1457232 RepID=A0A9X4L4R2_9BACL|nr:GH116 family glycosyl hydrolase [Cohnella rhizosphaerae]MDG0813442.1 non-lysosomal glucosylceramidase [Cohnella rhizosphaerae]
MQDKGYAGKIYGNGLDARIAYPLGGLGAGMIALEGTGALSHFSLRHKPDLRHKPMTFSAITVRGDNAVAKVLEGPIPARAIYDLRDGPHGGAAGGQNGRNYGLPRMAESAFAARFPFAEVRMSHPSLPVNVVLTGWSPFVPGNADDSSLPAAALEYRFHNVTDRPVELVYSFHARNVMACGEGEASASRIDGGFALVQDGTPGRPWTEGRFCAATDHPGAVTDTAWFRGDYWFDTLTMLWRNIEGAAADRLPQGSGKGGKGASLYVPLSLQPGESVTVRLRLSWFVPASGQRHGEFADAADPGYYKPWYASAFADGETLDRYWRSEYDRLRSKTAAFSDCLHSSGLPGDIVEAVSANLPILKSPTMLRQYDGRVWAWEGCFDEEGSCYGTCTHVWNYAQALAHLFPGLEREIRRTEFTEGQDEAGHQSFRVPLPIAPSAHAEQAAADGQLGGIMKLYREWRIGGDTDWMLALWPKAKASLQYAIRTWDPRRTGVLEEPHHNTYDIELWGPNGMSASLYLGALKAAASMAEAAGESAEEYETLYAKGRLYAESALFNGEYFEQQVRWKGLNAELPQVGHKANNVDYSEEAYEIFLREGPKYQYGAGCLADGVIGCWLAAVCGLGDILDPAKVASHLLSVYRYNFKPDMSEHVNPQRPGFALGQEGGLLICTWPRGGEPTLPLQYSNEVWPGLEYQVASHLIYLGYEEEGLSIVRACRARYDGRVRNPFSEYECGEWYGRSLSSYALLWAYGGIRYDAVDRTLYVRRAAAERDFSNFISTASGYGTAGVKGGRPFVSCAAGDIAVDRVEWY